MYNGNHWFFVPKFFIRLSFSGEYDTQGGQSAIPSPVTSDGAAGTTYLADDLSGIPIYKLIIDGRRTSSTPRLASSIIRSDDMRREFYFDSLDIMGESVYSVWYMYVLHIIQ